jgi:hypothetical protein
LSNSRFSQAFSIFSIRASVDIRKYYIRCSQANRFRPCILSTPDSLGCLRISENLPRGHYPSDFSVANIIGTW